MADLWSQDRSRRRAAAEPLARRMRPRSLDEVLDREHIVGSGKLLRRMLGADRMTPAIFRGPPGTGEKYQYPHNSADGYVLQEYLGVDRVYDIPTDRGYEAAVKKRLDRRRPASDDD